MNQVGRPSGLGIKTGAFPRPPDRRISQPVARKEKNGGFRPDSRRSMYGTAVTAQAVRPFLFFVPEFLLPFRWLSAAPPSRDNNNGAEYAEDADGSESQPDPCPVSVINQ
jgi:hypothetical protein